MNYFDLHCDTLTELYKNRYTYSDSPLHISGKNRKTFEKRFQAAAVWTDFRLNDEEGFEQFKKVIEYSRNDAGYGTEFEFCTNADSLRKNSDEKTKMVLAVEDGRITAGKPERIDFLYETGIRIVTPVWQGISCIGGAYDTDDGASDFGRHLISRCFQIGIIPDISHASRKLSEEIIRAGEKAGKPVIASHSNSYSVCPHPRNLTDDEFRLVKDMKGVVGISLAPQHLKIEGTADSNDVIKHIAHYMELGGENTVCLGCDFDGIDKTPEDINGEKDITVLYNALINAGFGSELTDKIFYKNALEFFINNL